MMERIRQIRRRLAEAIRQVERESVAEQIESLSGEAPETHWDIIGVTIVTCVVLTLLEFHGSSSDWDWLAWIASFAGENSKQAVEAFFQHGTYGRLHRLAFWATCTSIGYMVVPMLWTKFVMRRSLREMGLSPRGFFRHAWIYAILYLVVLPAVYLVSGNPTFQATYPFYDEAGRSAYDFIVWECFYALQFMSLEFLFRGFLIHGLKRRFGFYAIFVSVIPYCMIHFGKPFPEAIGSILAGLTLGAFSLFTGSIWLGVVIHISVAISMDVFALT